ncbi:MULTISPECIES: beta-galactosidase [unclassified Kitasatospora]|uniref:beta-galactosidase n=1 Tax=unclassified Kitasatospora TaxID=2633591 RepID=UPI00070F272E|nr:MULTISPECIES: beta-galactosidase [unclassified Kitasatospora]KQV14609.1 beta-galactosidase [Kitasatospora sp. Root107]KRB72422.1 beta-galactosidase [Kitasatospora sp. Root187]
MTARQLTDRLGALAFGGDYNPEQWDEGVWKQDDELMRTARVNLATVGVFSWALLEPAEGRYEFGWLDGQLDRLHANRVAVDLATPTASPPPWFTLAHPDAMPVGPDGTRLTHGSRDTYCLAAPAYRRAARRIASALAERYGDHPALALWHVHNEYATLCWCEHTAAAFRVWLRARHGSLDVLNDAWGTAFWSQRYSSWEQVQPPRATQWHHNPGQALDFRRFWSDEARAAYREQRDAIRAHSDRPVTTNLMVPGYQNLDLWAFGREVDLVTIDHYPAAPGVDAAADTAFGADRARSFGGGAPWLLMEQGTNTVYAGDRVLAKEPGDILRHTLGHIARGSEGALFFQWRQSRAGAEQWHSAMVPHAGPDSRIFREVTEAGEAVARLGELAGSTVRAEVAVLHDSDAWWALESDGLPSADLDYHATLRRAHRALWDAGVTVDFAHPEHDLTRYQLVVAPALFLLSDAGAANLRRYVAGGGTLLVQHSGGAVDERLHARLGGYPAAPLREALGVRVEEHRPLRRDEETVLSDGSRGTAWSEVLRTEGAELVAAYTGGMLAGGPALTRHGFGAGTGWYLSTRLDDTGYAALVTQLVAEAGVAPVLPGLPPGVEAVTRHASDGRRWHVLINHRTEAVPLSELAHDLLTDGPVNELRQGGCAVLRA